MDHLDGSRAVGVPNDQALVATRWGARPLQRIEIVDTDLNGLPRSLRRASPFGAAAASVAGFVIAVVGRTPGAKRRSIPPLVKMRLPSRNRQARR
jgi:hypothetical protein